MSIASLDGMYSLTEKVSGRKFIKRNTESFTSDMKIYCNYNVQIPHLQIGFWLFKMNNAIISY